MVRRMNKIRTEMGMYGAGIDAQESLPLEKHTPVLAVDMPCHGE